MSKTRITVDEIKGQAAIRWQQEWPTLVYQYTLSIRDSGMWDGLSLVIDVIEGQGWKLDHCAYNNYGWVGIFRRV